MLQHNCFAQQDAFFCMLSFDFSNCAMHFHNNYIASVLPMVSITIRKHKMSHNFFQMLSLILCFRQNVHKSLFVAWCKLSIYKNLTVPYS
jgi:hypothetical protein